MGLITYVHDVDVLCVYGVPLRYLYLASTTENYVYLADFIDTAR